MPSVTAGTGRDVLPWALAVQQKDDVVTLHLTNSRRIFLDPVETVKKVDRKKLEELRASRSCEELEYYIVSCLMGRA